MTIIEADGVETEPLTVDSLNIFAGERQWDSAQLQTDETFIPCHSSALLHCGKRSFSAYEMLVV